MSEIPVSRFTSIHSSCDDSILSNFEKFTVVTSLIDIGRSSWNDLYKRDTNLYFYYLSRVLNLDCNFYIFMDERYIEFFQKLIKDKKNVVVKPISIDKLLMYKHRDRIVELMGDENYAYNTFDKTYGATTCPELTIPEYNIVVNSKVDLMKRASDENPFGSNYFVWIDAGYGHGKIDIPERWTPPLTDKIGVLCLRDPETIPEDYELFFKQHVDIVNGGFFCCSKNNIQEYYNLYYSVIETSLNKGITDDDQYTVSMCYSNNKNLFSTITNSNWYCLFDNGLKFE